MAERIFLSRLDVDDERGHPFIERRISLPITREIESRAMPVSAVVCQRAPVDALGIPLKDWKVCRVAALDAATLDAITTGARVTALPLDLTRPLPLDKQELLDALGPYGADSIDLDTDDPALVLARLLRHINPVWRARSSSFDRGTFYDSFTDTTGTNLEDHTPDAGTGWVFEGANADAAQITANELSVHRLGGFYGIDPDEGPNCYAQAKDLRWGTAHLPRWEGCFLCTRYQDSSNYIGFYLYAEGSSGLRSAIEIGGTFDDTDIQGQGSSGATYRLESDGSAHTLSIVGTGDIGPSTTEAALNSEATSGLFVNDNSGDPLIDDMEIGSLGADNSLTGNDLESASELDAPTLGQTFNLTGNDLESAVELDAPTLGQTFNLTGNDLESAVEFSSPTLDQADNQLTGLDLEIVVELSAPSLEQRLPGRPGGRGMRRTIRPRRRERRDELAPEPESPELAPERPEVLSPSQRARIVASVERDAARLRRARLEATRKAMRAAAIRALAAVLRGFT